MTSFSLLLHIRANLGMMLARDYASCHAARSTLVMLEANNVHKNQMACKSLDLNHIGYKQISGISRVLFIRC